VEGDSAHILYEQRHVLGYTLNILLRGLILPAEKSNKSSEANNNTNTVSSDDTDSNKPVAPVVQAGQLDYCADSIIEVCVRE
jgi:hypothetical protein